MEMTLDLLLQCKIDSALFLDGKRCSVSCDKSVLVITIWTLTYLNLTNIDTSAIITIIMYMTILRASDRPKTREFIM